MRKISAKGLKKKAWKVFSLWVRKRNCDPMGYSMCVTCGAVALPKDLNAGHFIHGHSKITFMDDRNVHPQCIRCNMYLSGNLIEYAAYMKKTYGWETVDALRELSHQIWKPTRDDLEAIIKKYSVDHGVGHE